MSEQKKQSSEGKPMFVESLMTSQEWRERMIKFPRTSHLTYNEAHSPKPNPFKWRYGSVLSDEEIFNINSNLDDLRKMVEKDL